MIKPVSKTAYYCCGIRMQDAESSKPFINDKYARRLLGEEGLAYWQDFRHFKKPNASNTARIYMIDERIKDILYDVPDTKIFLIGAGLDSRAYRFKGGRWIEIDEENIMNYKNQKLPIKECPNPLVRLPINFEKDRLRDHLHPYGTDERVVIIIEGVILYLSNTELLETISDIQETFPNHIILCDLMKKDFFKYMGKKIHRVLVESGTTFKDIDSQPSKIFTDKGYRLNNVQSAIKKSQEMGLVNIPRLITHHLLSKFMMGYSVYEFEFIKNPLDL